MTEKWKQQNDADSIEANDQNVDQTVAVGAYFVLEDLFILKGKKIAVDTCCTRIPTRDKRLTSIRTTQVWYPLKRETPPTGDSVFLFADDDAFHPN